MPDVLDKINLPKIQQKLVSLVGFVFPERKDEIEKKLKQHHCKDKIIVPDLGIDF